MISKKLLLFSLLALFLSYKIYKVPVPDGAEGRMKLKLQFAYMDLFVYVAQWLDYGNIVGMATSLRWAQETQVKLLGATIEGVDILDTIIDGVPVRIFTPHGQPTTRAGMVYFHGGGYILGSVNTHTPPAAYISKNADMVVISVEYRLVPEHSKRDAFDDCATVSEHVLRHSTRYGIDPARVVLAGDSAGGNFAAGLSLYLRDHNVTPQPRLQVLIYPAVQNIDLQLPSYQQNANGPILSQYLIAIFRSYIYVRSAKYVQLFETNRHVPGHVRVDMAQGRISHDIIPDENKYTPYRRPDFQQGGTEIWQLIKEGIFDGYNCPLMADSHENLPEAYIFTGQYDPFRDEGYLYAHRLRESGVTVTHNNCRTCWHGLINAVTKQQDATNAVNDIVTFLNVKLNG